MELLFEQGSNGQTYMVWLLDGVAWTLILSAAGGILALAIGLVVGVGRTSRQRLVAATARLFVELFRNIPLILQMFIWFFVVPEMLPRQAGDFLKQMPPPWSSFIPALMGLGLYTAARIAEQVKSGIEALPSGQEEAAIALGLHRGLTYRLVILPQAIRIIVPTLTSEAMGVIKNSSVASTVGLLELTAETKAINDETFRTFAAFAVGTILYLLLAVAAFALMQWAERRSRLPGLPARRQALRQAPAFWRRFVLWRTAL